MEFIIDFYVDFAMCFILLLKYRVGGMRMNWGAVKRRLYTLRLAEHVV